ncbi:MAG: hypothetical protein NC226_09520 [Bacteroides cellulosilyticus]|nr:hypothetical protein [Bacteroides cellulosilyticus]
MKNQPNQNKMDEKRTTTKRRILELVKNQGFQVSKFFNEIGDSYENYKGRSLDSSPSVDILVKIRTKIPEANINWILTGDGEMLVKNNENFGFVEKILEKVSEALVEHKKEYDDIICQNGKIIEQNGEVVKQNGEIIKQNSALMLQNAEAMEVIKNLSEKLK